jgi:hypothetical protein
MTALPSRVAAGRAPLSSASSAPDPLGDSIVLWRRGLQFPRQLPFERWLGIGRQLSESCTSSAWCLGDWLAYGETCFNGRYRAAIELTSLDYQTLRNYAWVAKRFSHSRRRDALSFGHHAEVAALPEPEQEFWLRKAEELAWSVKQLRREVRASLRERLPGAPPLQVSSGTEQPDRRLISLSICVSPEHLETFRAAASRAGLSVEKWIVLAVEEAVRREPAAHGASRS